MGNRFSLMKYVPIDETENDEWRGEKQMEKGSISQTSAPSFKRNVAIIGDFYCGKSELIIR